MKSARNTGVITFVKNSIKRFRRTIADESQNETAASKRRLARAGLSSATMASVKIVQMGVGIVSVPILLTYLGREGYGLIITVTSVLGWFSLTDIGIGLGVKNALIEAFGRDDRLKAKSYVSTGFFGLAGIALFLLVAFSVSWRFIPWNNIFKISTTQFASELNMLVLVCATLIFLRIPLSIIGSIYSAEQRDYVNSLWGMAGMVLSFVALVAVVKLDGGIVWLAGGRNVMPLLSILVCGLFFFLRKGKWLLPRIISVSRTSWRRIWSSGLSFFIIQISLIAIFQSDIFLVNYFINTNEVPLYSMPARMFLYVNAIIFFIVTPFWSAFGEAAQKDHWSWIRKTFRNLIVTSLAIAIVMAIFLTILGPAIINLWSRGMVQSSRGIIIVLGLYSMVHAWTNVHAIFLNGLDRMHKQAGSAVIQAILNIGISIFLVKRMGILGVALGSLISYSLTTAWFLPLESYKILKAHRA